MIVERLKSAKLVFVYKSFVDQPALKLALFLAIGIMLIINLKKPFEACVQAIHVNLNKRQIHFYHLSENFLQFSLLIHVKESCQLLFLLYIFFITSSGYSSTIDVLSI